MLHLHMPLLISIILYLAKSGYSHRQPLKFIRYEHFPISDTSPVQSPITYERKKIRLKNKCYDIILKESIIF